MTDKYKVPMCPIHSLGLERHCTCKNTPHNRAWHALARLEAALQIARGDTRFGYIGRVHIQDITDWIREIHNGLGLTPDESESMDEMHRDIRDHPGDPRVLERWEKKLEKKL